MRWPWQRSEGRRSDAAAPRAAAPAASAPDAPPPPVPPAGWAFLAPLQRQVSDAPPAVLRPAFVSTLPTRTVPSSLGTMGHLVDDGAPAGTVAVDGGALGAPVQRSVAADLALRPGRTASRTPAAGTAQVQRATDAAGPASLDERAVVETAEGPRVAEATEVPPPVELSEHDAVAPGADEAPPDRRAPATVEPAGTAPGTNSLRADGSRPVPPAQPLVRPTLQRSTPPARGADGTDDSSPEHADVSLPAVPAPRRVGLGAPLPSRPLQRTPLEDAAGAAPPLPAGMDAATRPAAATDAATPRAEGSPATAGDGPSRLEDLPLQRNSAEGPHEPPATEASSSGAPPPSADAPLIGEARLAATIGAAPGTNTRVAAGAADHSHDAAAAGGAAPPARPPSLTSTSAPTPTPAMPTAALQRVTSTPGPPTEDAVPHDDAAMGSAEPGPVDAPAAGPPAPAAGPPAPAVLQRSVGLAPARAIVPALRATTMGAASMTRLRGGAVVVARVVAPVPPTAPRGDPARSRGSAASTPTAESRATSAWSRGADAGRGSTGFDSAVSGGSVEVDEWASEAPVAAASVSRLASSEFARLADHVEPAPTAASEPMPVAAALPRSGSGAQVVQRTVAGESGVPAAGVAGSRTAVAAPEPAPMGGEPTESLGIAVQSAPAPSSTTPAPAPPAAAPENVEQLVRKLYGPLVRRIKAELLLDRERRGIRIDGI
ncbi:hypothetical protein [Agromyces bauzanensis]|uniref:Uncharacterized protein n=1 Tax=Agromyces bauzanensis TaxID=1308924 RepID=A0A917UWX9_9MICO|nr:hypothetical protein [Agromyces bauzanensis]GGJ91545.1 hypothetical protein GCM10011372_32530 [Agromyces bauzanensis]